MTPSWRADLRAVHDLLERHAESFQDGDADALPALGQSLRQSLGQLARSSGGRPLPAEDRALVAQLALRAQSLQSMIARRARHVDASLQALGTAHDGLRESQVLRTYGAGGVMSRGAARPRGFERA